MSTKKLKLPRADAVKADPARPEFFTTRSLSEHLEVPEGTLRNWRLRGYGPKGFKVGNGVRYRRSVVEAWIASQEAA